MSDAPTGSDVRETAQHIRKREVTPIAREKAGAAFDGRKGRALREMGHLASALRYASSNLRQQDGGSIGATVTDRIADGLERACDTLQGIDLDSLIGDARELSRRNPALLLGSCAAIGFVAVRFLKSFVRNRSGSLRRGRARSDIAGGSPTVSYAEEV